MATDEGGTNPVPSSMAFHKLFRSVEALVAGNIIVLKRWHERLRQSRSLGSSQWKVRRTSARGREDMRVAFSGPGFCRSSAMAG